MQPLSSTLPAIEITARAARRLAGGYLWVFSNEIVPREDLPQTASWCRFARNGNTVAVGYFNRHSLIAGRALAYGEKSDIQQLMIARLHQAFARRRPFAAVDPMSRGRAGEALWASPRRPSIASWSSSRR